MADEYLPTFGDDMPDTRPSAEGPVTIPGTPLPEPPDPNKQAQPQTQHIPVPIPVPVPQQDSGNQFLQQMAQWKQQQEDEARQQRFEQEWNTLNTPPGLPDDPDDLVTDPKKLKAALESQANWAKNLVNTTSRMTADAVAALQREAAESRVARAELAVERARGELWRQGVQDMDAHWQDVDRMFSQSPDRYWELRTNPRALIEAVHIVRRQKAASGQPLPAQAPQPNPYAGGGVPRQGAETIQKDDSLRRAERVLGIKFDKNDIARRKMVS